MPSDDNQVANYGNAAMARLDMEGWDSEENQALRSTASQISNIPFYEGHVEHGYALGSISTSQRCPRCRAMTQQHYANFIYATQIAPRVMFAPAGYFCTQCPTVMIDEDMIRSGIRGNFNFQGVLGLDYDGRQKPDFFRTWNGKKAVYILDENQIPQGLSTIEASHQERLINRSHKTSKRKRLAKESRKKNRRKR